MANDPIYALLGVFGVFLGLAAHFAKAMMQNKIAGVKVNLVRYWLDNPYQTLYCLIGCVAGYVSLYLKGAFVPTNEWMWELSIAAGFASNSIVDMFGGRSASKV